MASETASKFQSYELQRRSFYLLVEEGARELDSRILIAAHLSARGASVWFGQQRWFANNYDRLDAGVVLFKGNNIPQLRDMREAKRNGHVTVSIEEESFGLLDLTAAQSYHTKVPSCCDCFLVQSSNQKAYVVDDLGVPGDRVKIVGNPRADLLQEPFIRPFREKAQKIAKRMGAFVLINTNYGITNPAGTDAYGLFRRLINLGAYDPGDPASMQNFMDLCRFERSNIHAVALFIGAIKRIEPNLHVVLRPHPTENADLWHLAYRTDPQVSVIREGSHLEWILASQCMVHTSCTTGLEAYLLGHRAIGLVPDHSSPWKNRFISNFLSELHVDPVSAAYACLETPSPTGNSKKALAPYLQIDAGQLAAALVADVLAELSIEPSSRANPAHPAGFRTFLASERQLEQMSVGLDSVVGRYVKLARDACLPTSCEAKYMAPNVFLLLPVASG